MLDKFFIVAEASSGLRSKDPVTRLQATIRQDARKQQARMTPEARAIAQSANRGTLEANRRGRPTRGQTAMRNAAIEQLPNRGAYATTDAQRQRVERQRAGSATRN